MLIPVSEDTRTERPERRPAALTAGLALILMAIAAAFSYGYAHGSLVVPGDAGATYRNLSSSGSLFAAELFGWVLILIADIAAAWALYLFFRPVQPRLALLGAWLRLVYAALLGVAVSNLLFVRNLALPSDTAAALGPDSLQALTTLHLDAFESIWSMGLIVFGGHLLIVGWLAWRSSGVLKAIGLSVGLAGIGYLAVHLCSAFLPQHDRLVAALTAGFVVPMTAGELGLAIWMLARGGRPSRTA